MKHWTCKPRPSALALAALAALASPLLGAQEVKPNTGMYVGISAGESQATIDNIRITQELLSSGFATTGMSEDRRDPGYKAYLGFPINPYWALEAGYFDLGRFGFTSTTTPAGTLTGTARIQGLNLDVVATLPITERWSLLGRVGATYADTQDNFSGTGAVNVSNPSPSKRETNYKYGFGTQYAFTPALTLRLEAERYRVNDAVNNHGDVDLITLGLVYRFGAKEAPSQAMAMTPVVAPPPPPPPPAPPPPPPPPPAPVVTPAPVPVPVPVPVPLPMSKVKLEADSLFGFDQDSLQADGKHALDKLVTDLKAVHIDAIRITGHTDRLGKAAYNDSLSKRRAEAVQNYLVQVGGLPAATVTAVGVGSSMPDTKPGDCKGKKATQALITCLRPDRRVEVEVSGLQTQR